MSSAVAPCKPFIRKAVTTDITELALTMRFEDVAEVHHASRSTPLEALIRGFVGSDQPYAIERDGRVVAIFGMVPFEGRGACPWMLGAPNLRHCTSLLRQCRKIVDDAVEQYGFLANAVWASNKVHVNWIRWLGFEFYGNYTRNGEEFLTFHKGTYV